MDPELEKQEKDMKTKQDTIDEGKDKEVEELKESLKKSNHISRMYKVNEPKWLTFSSILISVCNGAILPFIGIFIGKMLFVL